MTADDPTTAVDESRTTTGMTADDLPATAGFLPVLGVIGVLALGAGYFMRKRRSTTR